MAKEEELMELSKPSFWDNRYAAEQTSSDEPVISAFEWSRDFSKLRLFFEKHLPEPPSRELELHLGCGDSVRFPPF